MLTAAFIDIDNFKAVNDRHGHARGDVVLAAVAGAMDGASRAGDMVFRIGGDEFAMLLPETGDVAAQMVVERACGAIADVGEEVEASFGVATWPRDGGSKEVLLAEADHRLYAMKPSVP